MRLPLRPAATVAVLLSIGLAGCVSVLPKSKPSQLYTFVKTDKPSTEPAPGSEIGLLLGGLTFPRAAGGDGILTRTGNQAAYIEGARWVGPAVILFREATDNVFDRSGGLRLISRGEVGKAAGILRLDVRDFELRYASPGATPSAVVTVEVRLRGVDGAFVGEKRFEAETPAADNRVGPIVDAVATSSDKVLTEASAWIQAEAASLPQRPVQAAPAAPTPDQTPPAAAALRP